MLDRLKKWARDVKRDVLALYLAARDPRVPWYAKALAALVAAYALSPVDVIPDFIPVLGYLDDLIILPLGIATVVRLIPGEVMADLRLQAEERILTRPRSWFGALVVVLLWVIAAGFLVWLIKSR
ncbi:MAG: YkvA family protein [bacterium]|nr:YkvA family protein [bacterium]MDT8366820.1 YkvA family protein [bacterium]